MATTNSSRVVRPCHLRHAADLRSGKETLVCLGKPKHKSTGIELGVFLSLQEGELPKNVAYIDDLELWHLATCGELV